MQVGDGIYDLYTLNGLFGGPAGRTNQTFVEDNISLDDLSEEELAAANVTIVKKDLCDDGEECKDLDF
jgi:hypothetical protein